MTTIAVVGLGYVGLPLAVEFGKKYRTIGFDLSAQKIESYKIGWTLAFAMLGVLVAVGFQAATEKVGTVDLAKVMDDSDLGKAGQDKVNKMNQDRIAVLQFMSENRVLTEDQSKRVRDLSLKADCTKDEQAELDRLLKQADQLTLLKTRARFTLSQAQAEVSGA